MSHAEKTRIQIAAKLYEMQDTAQRLFGSAYNDRVEPIREAIRKARDASDETLMQIALKLLTAAEDDGMTMLLIGAAVVDLAEESPE